MIKMIIADDEPVITRGLVKIIDWKKLGIEIIGCYEDGKTAFQGIVSLNPDIALLDINMPEKSGIDILKELQQLQMKVKVIFISGFHEFEYARAALEYGAKGYLLKPIVKEELIQKIENCLEEMNDIPQISCEPGKGSFYNKLLDFEEQLYTLVLIRIEYKNESEQEKKLIEFSATSYIEKYVEEESCGVFFRKEKGNFIVFKGCTNNEVEEYIKQINKTIKEKIGYGIQGIAGTTTMNLGDIPEIYAKCLEKMNYYYFFNVWNKQVVFADCSIASRTVTREEIENSIKNLKQLIIKQEWKNVKKEYGWYQKLISIAANGNKEDACYYFCLAIVEIEKYLDGLFIKYKSNSMSEMLEHARRTTDFLELGELFESYILMYFDAIKNSVEKNVNKDIQHAKAYIEEHYREDLSLKVMAEEMSMNPYYFSSFFKKASGMNFKDYVSEVRIEHAVSLLISTDKSIREIMMEVGFVDLRSFSKAFHRKYSKSPAAYRKEALYTKKIEEGEV